MKRKINWRFIFNENGFFTAVFLGLAGFAIGEMFSSSSSSKNNSPAQAPLPSIQASSQTAQASQGQSRAAALAAGGLTDYTGGTGIVLGSDVKSACLIGG